MLEKIGFHEATVVGLKCSDALCQFWLEDVTQIDGSKAAGCLTLAGVEKIEVDDVSVIEVDMEFGDGEIVDLEFLGTELNSIIQWNDFARRTTLVRHYRIVFGSAQWDLKQ